MHELLDRFISLFFPKRCILCDEVVAWEDLWCRQCPCPYLEDTGISATEGHFQGAITPFPYKDAVRCAILRLKKEPDLRTAQFFAQEMARLIKSRYPAEAFSLVVPVPMSAEQKAERKFNHAELLASELGKLLEIPMEAGALYRRDGSQVQHRLDARQRRQNAYWSYQMGSSHAHGTVLLVDDILTTGATVDACAINLLQAGAQAVYVATAARTVWED